MFFIYWLLQKPTECLIRVLYHQKTIVTECISCVRLLCHLLNTEQMQMWHCKNRTISLSCFPVKCVKINVLSKVIVNKNIFVYFRFFQVNDVLFYYLIYLFFARKQDMRQANMTAPQYQFCKEICISFSFTRCHSRSRNPLREKLCCASTDLFYYTRHLVEQKQNLFFYQWTNEGRHSVFFIIC